MRLISLVLLFALFPAAACKKHSTSASFSLIGSWRLVCFSGGFAGFPRTAVDPTHTTTFVFRSDSTLTRTIDTTVLNTPFSVRLQASYITGRLENMLVIDGGMGGTIISNTHDTLLLSQDVNDGMTYWYSKM